MNRPSTAAKTPFDAWRRLRLPGCKVCRTKEWPPHAEGVCARCYGRIYQKRNRVRIAIYHGLWKHKQNVGRIAADVLKALMDLHAQTFGLRLTELRRGPFRFRQWHTVNAVRMLLVEERLVTVEKFGRSEIWRITPRGLDLVRSREKKTGEPT